MAYTFFPKSATEIKTTLKGNSKKIDDIVKLYLFLSKKFPKTEAPINIDPDSISKVNISRELQKTVNIANIKAQSKASSITIKFGSGSSGGRGVKNKGNAYEGELANAIRQWWSGELPDDPDLLDPIEKICNIYDLEKWATLDVVEVGELNNKRPFIYSPQVLISSQIPVTNNNLGPIVTDITLQSGRKKEYLSLKTGGTVTFFNSGIKTVLTPQEIKSGEITNLNGLKILDMFNIDNHIFCDIFNGNLKESIVVDVWKTMSTKQKSQLKIFLKSGIGHGYTIVHKLTNKTKVYVVDEKYMNEAATPKSCTIYYGGKSGTGKRIDMEIETGHYTLKLNIRDTQGGDGYPTRMMCDYSYLKE
jgi:hypothetical protein